MSTSRLSAVVVFAFLLGACEKDRTGELQGEISRIQSESTSLQQELAARDRYIDEVMNSVNTVYADLEKAKSKESKLIKKTLDAESAGPKTSEEVRKAVLQQIAEIHDNLKSNRRKLAVLQKQLKESSVQYSSLEDMVRGLKESLDARERSITVLETTVRGLENTVAENQKIIFQKDEVIEGQKHLMNTVYYVVGTRDELRERGIISEEGGILWGLLGTTTTLTSGLDHSHFQRYDMASNPTIRITGKVDEIVPRRDESFFSLAHNDNATEDLTITRPDKFWQDRYLVIVLD